MAASRVQLRRQLRLIPHSLGGGIPLPQPVLVLPCRTVAVGWQALGKKYSKPIYPNVPFRKGQAKDLIYRLTAEERQTLLRELQRLEQSKDKSATLEAGATAAEETGPPTSTQLRGVALYNAMPFVGFGFLDNFIMIVAGDYIDFTIGAALGISTLAAAALGNMVSDVAGIGSAWYVESIVERIGGMPPQLSPAQLSMMSTRWSAHFGRAIGVAVGCFLGMVPLLFLHKRRSTDKAEPAAAKDEKLDEDT